MATKQNASPTSFVPPAPGAPALNFAPSKLGFYPVLVAAFGALLIISNICATKGVLLLPQMRFDLGPIHVDGLVLDGAFWIFPLTYVIGDVISEVYGFRAMRRAVWWGFAATALSALAFTIAIGLPAAPFYENQSSFAAVLGVVPWILLGSIVGFVGGELVNSYVLVRMKRRTGEPKLVRRLMGSSLAGQIVDTTAFCLIAAPVIGITDFSGLLNFTVVGIVWKLLVEAAMLPVTTQVIGWIKRHEPEYAAKPGEVESTLA